ncbi:Uncharacterised protein [Bordetella pertussis]|nr:Uncharacterised protein [Bordetella pertussis]
MGSCVKMASRIASEIWSATLSGCPSETDSEVNRKSLLATDTSSRTGLKPAHRLRGALHPGIAMYGRSGRDALADFARTWRTCATPAVAPQVVG